MKQTLRTVSAMLFAAMFAATFGMAQSEGAAKPDPGISGPVAAGPAATEPVKTPVAEKAATEAAPQPPPSSGAPAGVQTSPLTTPPPQQAPKPKRTKKDEKGETAAEAAAPAAQEKPYVLGPLDVIEVRVWDNAKVSGMFPIGPDGMISMPLIGQFKADGLTLADTSDLLKTKLSEFIDEPEVNVQIVKINSKKYTIIGGCAHQGEAPLVAKTTVLDALANCGGFRDFANLKKIKIYRGNQKFDFNYKDALQNKHPEQNIYLENGDRIVIPE